MHVTINTSTTIYNASKILQLKLLHMYWKGNNEVVAYHIKCVAAGNYATIH